MMTLLRWALNVAALMIIPSLIHGIHVRDLRSALIAAVGIALLNLFVRPLLLLLTLPITVLTLGFFILVINALIFWFVANMVDGFEVANFLSAMMGAILYSVLTWLVDLALGDKRRRRR
jgi:putative membrane protein